MRQLSACRPARWRPALAPALALAAALVAGCSSSPPQPAAPPVAAPAPVEPGFETPRAPNVVPPDVVAHVRKMGRVSETSIASVYQARQQIDVPGVVEFAHLAYGSDPRQFVNVFAPRVLPATPVPVVVFMHGGGFIGGAVHTPGSFQYDHIGKFFARNGYVVVNVEYRLAPLHRWPEAGQDLAAAVAWTRRNAASYGGDPSKIFLMGHSAGATHVAHYTFDRRIQVNGGDDGVIGSILLSPHVSMEELKRFSVYYGPDFRPDMAPLNHVNERRMPVFLGVAQWDPQDFQVDVARLYTALCQRDNRCPAIKTAQQHSHLSSILHINTADDSYGSDLLTFMRDVLSTPPGQNGG